MNDEIKKDEMYEEEITTVDTYDESEESSSGNLLGKVVGVGLATAAVIGGIKLFKNRDKIKERKDRKAIDRLEKLGYVVYKSEVVEPDDEIESDIDESDNETDENNE